MQRDSHVLRIVNQPPPAPATARPNPVISTDLPAVVAMRSEEASPQPPSPPPPPPPPPLPSSPALVGAPTPCEALDSCGACTKRRAAKPEDGIRCVWCESQRACRTYVKATAVFPCADAVRSGGGYPGGGKCRKGANGAPAGQAAVRQGQVAPASSVAGGMGRSLSLLHVPPEIVSAGAADAPPPTLNELRAGSGSGSGGGGGGGGATVTVAPLWFESAASHFAEALPLGNGRLGAMVYGGAWRECVLLNEEGLVGCV